MCAGWSKNKRAPKVLDFISFIFHRFRHTLVGKHAKRCKTNATKKITVSFLVLDLDDIIQNPDDVILHLCIFSAFCIISA